MGCELLAQCAPAAARLDALLGGAAYQDAVQAAFSAIEGRHGPFGARAARDAAQPRRLVRALRARRVAPARASLLATPLPPDIEDEFANLARASSAKQRQIEAQDRVDFETYRTNYLDPQKLRI